MAEDKTFLTIALDKLFSWMGWYSPTKVEEMIQQAADKAIAEERSWHMGSNSTLGQLREQFGEDEFGAYDYALSKSLFEGVDIKTEDQDKLVKRISENIAAGRGAFDFMDEMTPEQVIQMQKVIRGKYFADPHCRGIIENWVNYTIGSGVKVSVEDEQVNEIIKQFRRQNKMIKREKQFVRMGFMEGELFIVYYTNKRTGDLLLRRARPDEITEIQTHPDDVETILGYQWSYEDPNYSVTTFSSKNRKDYLPKDKWVQDIDYKEYKEKLQGSALTPYSPGVNFEKGMMIQFVKFGMDDELRGRPPLQPVLRFLKFYEDWLMDRIILNHERSKVVWIKEVQGRTVEAIQRDRRAPKGGTMLTETANVKYRIENAQINAAEAKDDGLSILYAIGAGTLMPLHILNQRSDQQVYASIRKADTPFSQHIRSIQEFWTLEFERMYRQVIQSKVEAKILKDKIKIRYFTEELATEVLSKINEMYVEGASPDKIIETIKNEVGADLEKTKTIRTEDLPLSIEFPEIVKEDPKSQAEVLKIHQELGIVSMATLAAKAGYNWKWELTQMKKEEELFPSFEPEPKDSDKGEPSGEDNSGDPEDGDKGKE